MTFFAVFLGIFGNSCLFLSIFRCYGTISQDFSQNEHMVASVGTFEHMVASVVGTFLSGVHLPRGVSQNEHMVASVVGTFLSGVHLPRGVSQNEHMVAFVVGTFLSGVHLPSIPWMEKNHDILVSGVAQLTNWDELTRDL